MEVNFSLIGDSMVVQGDITETSRLLLNGIVNGNVESNHDVILDGKVNGDLKAKNLYIHHGFVDGNVTAEKIYCDNIELSVSGDYYGKLLPYKIFDYWERDEEHDVFIDLQKNINCTCISDLKGKENTIKIKNYLNLCDSSLYPIKNCLDLHEYLLGKKCDKKTCEGICLSIAANI